MNHCPAHPFCVTPARRGFTMPVVLIGVTGMLVLVIGLLSTLRLESQTARAVSNSYRAELIADSAIVDIESMLVEAMSQDDFIITEIESRVDGRSRRYSMLGRSEPQPGSAAHTFDWLPLYSVPKGMSGGSSPLSDMPESPVLASSADERAEIPLEPWQQPAIVSWREIERPNAGPEDEPIGRYAFYVEDLQSRIDVSLAGNDEDAGKHSDEWLVLGAPTPGKADILSPAATGSVQNQLAPLSTASVHTLFDNADEDTDSSSYLKTLMELREKMRPDGELEKLSLSMGHQQARSISKDVNLDRKDENGVRRLTNDSARTVEENMTFFLKPYFEQALVPPSEGIQGDVVGQPKLNLNELLQMPREQAIQEIAIRIEQALPNFDDQRKGGFPDKYLETLAANMLDYADADSDATTDGGVRGLDAYPLVNEFAMRFKWEGVPIQNGTKFVELRTETYVELWNMSNLPVSGQLQVSYETQYSFPLGPIPEVNLGDPDLLDDSSVTTHTLEKKLGGYYFPQRSITLQPNEIRLFSMGEVTYSFEVGAASTTFVPSPLNLENDETKSGYRMLWNDQLVDASRGNIERNAATLHFPTNTSRASRQKVRCSIPGHSFGVFGNFANNMGDPRICFYIDEPQSANGYPRNWSPWRRNIRLDLYNRRNGDKNIFTRVFPSEWPDGGHDASFGLDRFATNDQRIEPDASRFSSGLPAVEPTKAPMFLSNRGFFVSATELGHIYDPIMWDSEAGTSNPERWLDIDADATASPRFGGGNTLRVGRMEHSRFNRPGMRSSQLLDLFHAGFIERPESGSASPKAIEKSQRGPLEHIQSNVNINTASREVLRALLAGMITADPDIAQGRPGRVDRRTKAPAVRPFPDGRLESPQDSAAADIIADAIINQRPFASVSEAADMVQGGNNPVGFFGDRLLWENGEGTQWDDRAAEQIFAKLYNMSTVRSRNFKVTVVGQAYNQAGRPAATHRRVYYVFVDPGEREEDGSIIRENVSLEIVSEHAL